MLTFRASRGVLAPGDSMTTLITPQQLNPPLTPWHITFGTYGTRLHGSVAPTVDKQHNILGDPFLPRNSYREQAAREKLKFAPIYFSVAQRVFIEAQLPLI
jgi:hypothetical protein